MPSPEAIRKLSAIGALVLPVAVVKCATVFMGQTAPATAQAAPAVATSVVSTIAAPASSIKITAQQIAAAHHAHSLRLQPFGPTPLYFDKPQSSDATQSVETQATNPIKHAPGVETAPVPKFTLGAVMSTTTGGRALINGRPYREGEPVRDTTWSVASINSNNRSVTLSDSNTDRSVVVSVELPR
jgi:hypothetical protein